MPRAKASPTKDLEEVQPLYHHPESTCNHLVAGKMQTAACQNHPSYHDAVNFLPACQSAASVPHLIVRGCMKFKRGMKLGFDTRWDAFGGCNDGHPEHF